MKRENFTASASRAIDEGNRERQATAQRLALQFGTGAGGFDLNSLARLGEEGLAAFLSSLGNQNPFPNWRGGESAPDANPSPVLEAGEDFGWAILRSREPRWFVRAVVRGWVAGSVLAAIGSIVLRFVG